MIPAEDSALLIRFNLYIFFGTVAILTNLTVLIVLWSRREMRTTLVLFQALAIAELVNGISYIFAGVSRRIAVTNGYYHDQIHPIDCAKAVFPEFLILGGLLPSSTSIMLALERLIAIQFYTFYNRSCRLGGKITIACIGFLGATVMWIIGMMRMILRKDVLHSRMCDVLSATGQEYGIAHFTLVAALFFASFILLILVAVMANRKQTSKVSKEDTKRNRILFMITGASVLLVATPNVVLVLQDRNILKLNDLHVGIIYCLYGLSSSLNLFLSTRGSSKQRRDQIDVEINQLRDLLPLSASIKDCPFQLQLMSLSCIFIRKKHYLSHKLRALSTLSLTMSFSTEVLHLRSFIPKNMDSCRALKGFLMMVTQTRKLLYISENASEYYHTTAVPSRRSCATAISSTTSSTTAAFVYRELNPKRLRAASEEGVFICRTNHSRTAYHKFLLVHGRYVHSADYYQTVSAVDGPANVIEHWSPSASHSH